MYFIYGINEIHSASKNNIILNVWTYTNINAVHVNGQDWVWMEVGQNNVLLLRGLRQKHKH